MKYAALMISIFALAGCTQIVLNPNEHREMKDLSQQLSLAKDESLLVVGSSIRNAAKNIGGGQLTVYSIWVSFDPVTKKTTNQSTITLPENCGALISKSKACYDVQYYALKIPAGDYAYAWVFNAGHSFGFINFSKGSLRWQGAILRNYEFSDQAPISAQASTFHIEPGEVLYIGDVLLDFGTIGTLHTRVSTSATDQVQAFLAPTGLADRLVVRPIVALPVANEVQGAISR